MAKRVTQSRPPVQHRLAVGETIQFTVAACEEYSAHKIQVEPDEQYQVSCDPRQRWKDWFIPSGPNGFYNPLASLVGLRVKGVKCFCLCGAYNDRGENAFAIGSGAVVTARGIGPGSTLAFFANDTAGYYRNNKGEVTVVVKRLR